DYQITISEGQFASIVGVARRKQGSRKAQPRTTFEAVAVANDLIPQAVATEELDKDSFRSIYKSESYPPFCIGYAHNLAPDLQKKIRKTLIGYQLKGKLRDELGKADQTQFVEINYMKDWDTVRAVERALTALVKEHGGK